MGNNNGTAVQEREVQASRPTGDVTQIRAEKGKGATNHEPKEESETEKTIDKYQVVETEEKTLDISTMATNTEVSDEIVPPIKSSSERKESKDTLYVDIEEVGEETKPGEKSPLMMKSPKYEEMKEKEETKPGEKSPLMMETPVSEEKEKPSNATVGERELLLVKETSGDLSETVLNTPNESKVRKLSGSSSLFRSCMCCIQATS